MDMPVFLQLVQLYRKYGYEVRTGLNSSHFNNDKYAPFTVIYKNNKFKVTGGGIALQELYFFECLFSTFHPRSIFVIGNAFGWSTIAFALLNPNAKIVALDAGIEGADNNLGNDLTRQIAKEENLNIKVINGYSPQDVDKVILKELAGRVDFVFIDGLHTEIQQRKDYDAVKKYCGKEGVIIFHDILTWNLLKGFREIISDSEKVGTLLYRTPSGIGILYPETISDEIKWAILAFKEDESIVEMLLSKSRWATLKQFIRKALKLS